MKKYIIFITILLFSCATFAQNFFTYINKSNQFFDTLDAGKYTEAQVKSQFGELESVEGAESKAQDDYQIVILNCKFQKGSQPFQFVYNNKEKLIGFFLAPKSKVNYQLPTYADTTKYQEKYITIKSGKYELPGVITLPRTGSNFPIVVLVHGSGPADMDETVGVLKPFKDIAA